LRNDNIDLKLLETRRKEIDRAWVPALYSDFVCALGKQLPKQEQSRNFCFIFMF